MMAKPAHDPPYTALIVSPTTTARPAAFTGVMLNVLFCAPLPVFELSGLNPTILASSPLARSSQLGILQRSVLLTADCIRK